MVISMKIYLVMILKDFKNFTRNKFYQRKELQKSLEIWNALPTTTKPQGNYKSYHDELKKMVRVGVQVDMKDQWF